MGNIRFRAFTLAAILSVGACSSQMAEFTPSPVAGTSQTVATNTNTGNSYIKSSGATSAVAIEQINDEAYRDFETVFLVKVANGNPEPISFGPADIKVTQGGQAFQVMGIDEVKAAIKSKETAQEAFAILGMVAGVVAGGVAIHSGGAAAAAVMPASAMLIYQSANNISAASETAEVFNDETTKAGFLAATPLPPRSKLKGLFAVKGLSPKSRTNIQVAVGTDVHKFAFEPKL